MVSLSLLPADGGLEIASTGWTDGDRPTVPASSGGRRHGLGMNSRPQNPSLLPERDWAMRN